MKPSKKSSAGEKQAALATMRSKLKVLSRSAAEAAQEQKVSLTDFSMKGLSLGALDMSMGMLKLDLNAKPEEDQPLDKQTKAFEDDASKSLFAHVNASRAAHDHELELDFYFSIYFASAEERDTFLEHSGFGEEGDTIINGRELGKKLGFKLPEKSLRLHLKGPKKNVNLSTIRKHKEL